MNPALIFGILFFTVLLSGAAVLAFKISGKALKLILAFSGAFLLGVTLLHLVPEAYSRSGAQIGYFILLGFLLQILFEYFSEGIEHGHIHIHKHGSSAFPVTLMLALSVHSFLEGMPLAGSWNDSKQAMMTGIVLHNIPIAIALTGMLLQSGLSKARSTIWLIVFGLMTPLGTVAAGLLSFNDSVHSGAAEGILGVVMGIFLHVSTTILFESSEHHRFNFIKLLVILAGMALSIAL